MEWLYLAGSVASIISVFAVVLTLARRREVMTEKGFRMLFVIMVTIGVIGIGAITMALAQEPVMRNTGSAITLIGVVLLFIITIMVVYSAAVQEEKEEGEEQKEEERG